MPNVKLKGVILAENNMGDFDKMLTMLTPNVGKISCVAKGARRPKSSLMAGTQLFCFGEYLMYKGTTTYHLNSCELIEVFYNLRCDLDKLEYAMKINKIVQDVTNENQNSYRILQLYLNTLYTISETDMDLELVFAIFKLRIASLLGLTPIINGCVSCSEKEDSKLTYFSVKDNGLKCETCGKLDKSAIHISESALKAIKYTIMAPPKKLYSFRLKENALKEFKLVVDVFFAKHVENI